MHLALHYEAISFPSLPVISPHVTESNIRLKITKESQIIKLLRF